MPKISVITPTVRPEGLALVEKALSKQSFDDFEWIVVASTNCNVTNISHATAKATKFAWDPGKKRGDVWSLNKAYNAGIKIADGELIVSWQDWTYAKPDTLLEFWQHYEAEPKTLVSAVGNKYKTDSWDIMMWKDPRIREDMPSFYPCYWNDVEANLCSIPKQALYDVGGFDEEMDKKYGLDFYNVLHRIASLGGYDTKLDQSIKSYSLEHGRAKDWEEKNWIHSGYNEHVEKRKLEGKWPNVGYLGGK